MKKPVHTHTAPYYGGERFARTLEEAFGPGAKLHTSRRSLLRKYAPEIVIVIVVSAIAVAITRLVGP
jgi:hypothetical protein